MSNVINKKDLAEKLAEEFGCSKRRNSLCSIRIRYSSGYIKR